MLHATAEYYPHAAAGRVLVSSPAVRTQYLIAVGSTLLCVCFFSLLNLSH